MTDDINNSQNIEKLRSLISEISGKIYASPNECFEEISRIYSYFQELLRDILSHADFSLALKSDIEKLIEFTTPELHYELSESYSCNNDISKLRINVEYKLIIKSTPEEIITQVDEFYSTAVGSLIDPNLLTGVTPSLILKYLVDSYSSNYGIDNKEEIDRIVARLAKRIFIENPGSTVETIDTPDHDDKCSIELDGTQILKNVEEWQNLDDLLHNIDNLRLTVAGFFIRKCKAMHVQNMKTVSRLSRWLTAPKLIITSYRQDAQPVVSFSEKMVCIPFPTMIYRTFPDFKKISERLEILIEMFAGSSASLLKTNAVSLKHDLENITTQEPQEINISLKNIIEKNFNVWILEVDSESDNYATPEYFNVSRANVEKVMTTKPAVIGLDGKVIYKGLYVVPLDTNDTENEYHSNSDTI